MKSNMQNQHRSLARVLESFGKCYDEAHSIWVKQVGLPSDHRQLLDSPIDALLYFTRYAHERAGRNPRFPVYHRIAIKKACGTGLDIMSPAFPTSVWQTFERQTPYDERKGRHKTNEKLTQGPVMEVLVSLQKSREPNLIALLRRMSLKEAHKWLTDINGIGNKVASLFLRDIWYFIGEWPNTPPTDRKFLQPVDVWVRSLSERAFQGAWPRADLAFAEQIVNRCKSVGIDPIEFNKGAWFVGSHFDRLCNFFAVPETRRVDETYRVDFDIARAFQATAVLKGITSFRDAEAKKSIFWV